MIGINSRNLHTFEMFPDRALELAPLAPPGVTLVAASGIKTRADVERYEAAGIRGFLIGETLVTQDRPGGEAAGIYRQRRLSRVVTAHHQKAAGRTARISIMQKLLKNERLYYLDWLRVFAVMLLIPYHTGAIFANFDFHIKNNVTSTGLTIIDLFIDNWHMPSVFSFSRSFHVVCIKQTVTSCLL